MTLQARTQPEAFELFTRTHAHQHDTEGEEKFQYSVQVGSEEPDGSAAWLIPKNDFPLLHRLLSRKTRATKMVKELKTLTEESRASIGLGQYAQHTCCATHANAHLFPLTISREEAGGGVTFGRYLSACAADARGGAVKALAARKGPG